MFSQLKAKPAEFHVFDTTLRDGSQQEGLNLSVHDKLVITGLLDELGVGFIEGGWPGRTRVTPRTSRPWLPARSSCVTPRWWPSASPAGWA